MSGASSEWERILENTEHISVDYIVVTNGDQSIDPIKLREGDTIFGLTLYEIDEARIVILDNDFFAYWDLLARFSGETVLNGNLEVTFSPLSGFQFNLFTVDKECLDRIPVLLHEKRPGIHMISIQNHDRLFELLDLEIDEIISLDADEDFKEVFENLTIRIADFVIWYQLDFGGGAAYANILDIVVPEQYLENVHTVDSSDIKETDIILEKSSEAAEAVSKELEVLDYIVLTNAAEIVESTKLREGEIESTIRGQIYVIHYLHINHRPISTRPVDLGIIKGDAVQRGAR